MRLLKAKQSDEFVTLIKKKKQKNLGIYDLKLNLNTYLWTYNLLGQYFQFTR